MVLETLKLPAGKPGPERAGCDGQRCFHAGRTLPAEAGEGPFAHGAHRQSQGETMTTKM